MGANHAALEVAAHSASGSTVLVVAGVLDLSTYHRVRTALLQCAAEAPTAVVVDLRRAVVTDSAARAVFVAVSTEVGEWPGVSIVLVCPAEDAAVAAGSPIRRSLPVHETVDQALAAVGSPPPRRVMTAPLPNGRPGLPEPGVERSGPGGRSPLVDPGSQRELPQQPPRPGAVRRSSRSAVRNLQDAGTTLGVEEEFLLVDPGTGAPAPRAAGVLARAEPTASTLQAELITTQVEAASGVCRTLGELHGHLVEARAALTAAATDHGLVLLAAGVPGCDGPPPPRTVGPRFDLIHERFTALVADYQACGCHVHVGVPDRELAVAVLNHLSPWLPTLLALSANSPVRGGEDRGHASLRMVDQSRFPGSGLTPWFASAADYDRQVDALLECGTIVDERMTFWLARCSPHLPTVEVRAADTAIEPWEAVTQAALTRALVRTALAELAAGREAPRLDPQVAAAAVWVASRYGLDGPAVDPVAGARSTAWDRVRRLVAAVRPALEDLGDEGWVRAALRALRAAGSGAERQRRALANGPAALVRAATAGVWTPVPTGTPTGRAADVT